MYINKAKVYQACENVNNTYTRYINTSERGREKQSQTWEICFVVRATFSTSPPLLLWRISTIIDISRSLGVATPTTSSLKNSWTRKSLTYSRKNNTSHELASSLRPQSPTLSQYKVEHFVITWSNKWNHLEGGWIG